MPSLALLASSIAALAGLIALSAFFSSTESAVFSLPDEWIDQAAAGSDAGRTLQALRADPHRLLVTILVGNNIVNVAVTTVVTLLVAEFVPPGATVVLATLGASTLILVFGEIVPKSYGLGHAGSWSLRVAGPIAGVERALGPVVVVFDAVTRRLTRLVGGDADLEEQFLE